MSNYLANLMRHGADGYNCFLEISGTLLTLKGYGGNLQGNTPAYVRFSDGSTLVLQSNLTYDINGLNWDLIAEGVFTLYAGVQRVGSGSGQLCVALNPIGGTIDTLLKENCRDVMRHVAAPTATNGAVTWLFAIENANHTDTGWDMSQARVVLL